MSTQHTYYNNNNSNSSGFNNNTEYRNDSRFVVNECESSFSPGILDVDDKVLLDNSNRVSVYSSQFSGEITPKMFKDYSGINNKSNSNHNGSNFHDRTFDVNIRNEERENFNDESALESVVLVDVDKLSLDGGADWLTSKGKSSDTDSVDWMRDEGRSLHSTKGNKNSSINRSSTTLSQSPKLKRNDSSKLDKSNDYGVITQIIGIPPLSSSNKDLSTIGKELSIAKQLSNNNNNNNNSQQIIDMTPNLKLNSASNSNLLFGSGYKLADINDVQNVAKLQEQSLRMSFSTPLVNSGMGMAINKSSGNINVINLDVDGSNVHSDVKMKGSTNVTKIQQNNKMGTATSNRNIQKGRPSAGMSNAANPTNVLRKPSKLDHQSVPNSPYNSSQQLTRRIIAPSSNIDPHQKSLPNLTRNAPMSLSRAATSRSTNPNQSRVNASLLQHNTGPPTRTVSQPTVTSQLKLPQKTFNSRTTSSHIVTRGLSTAQPSNSQSKNQSTSSGARSTRASTMGSGLTAGTKSSLTSTTARNQPIGNNRTSIVGGGVGAAASRQLPSATSLRGQATSVIGVSRGRVSNIGLNNNNNNSKTLAANTIIRRQPTTTLTGPTSSRLATTTATGSQRNYNASNNSNITTNNNNNNSSRLYSTNNTTTTQQKVRGNPVRALPPAVVPLRGFQTSANAQNPPPHNMRSNQQNSSLLSKTLKSVSGLRSNTPMNPLNKKGNVSNLPMKPSATISPMASNSGSSNNNSRIHIGAGAGVGGAGGSLMRSINSNNNNNNIKDEDWKEGCY